MMKPLEIELQTLTPLWTGGVDQTCDRLHETGLIGSLRWWYEALVRGLGGYACDPTSEDRCPDNDGKHCVACELFGCTGWSRKFRLRVLDKEGNLITDSLKQKGMFFRLQFVELKPILSVERQLLELAVEIAANYGAFGGKTTLKPQNKPRVGDDYGVVRFIGQSGVPKLAPKAIREYLHLSKWRPVKTDLPDLRWFFFLKGKYLNRQQINNIIGLSPDGKRIIGHEEYQEFLRGRRGDAENPAVSKKLFSFRADKGRVWGYARDRDMRDKIIERLRKELGEETFVIETGEEVLNVLRSVR